MAILEAFSSSKAVSTTEWSMPRGASFNSGILQTTAGIYQTFVNTSGIVGSGEFQLKVYEVVKAVEYPQVVYNATFVGPQSPSIWVSPSLVLMNGWDQTLQKIVGGDITFSWSIRKVG